MRLKGTVTNIVSLNDMTTHETDMRIPLFSWNLRAQVAEIQKYKLPDINLETKHA